MRTMMLAMTLATFATVAKAEVIDLITSPFETTTVSGLTSHYSMLDTGFPGGAVQYGLAYENFSFASDMTLTQIDWIGAYDGDESTPDGEGGVLTNPDLVFPTFTISIYGDDPLAPGTPSATAIATFNAGTASENSIAPVGGEDFFYSYSAPVNFAASAGTEYWASISGALDYAENGWNLALSADTLDGDNYSFQDFAGDNINTTHDYAVRFTAVPEPGSLAFVFAGFAGVALRRRRRSV